MAFKCYAISNMFDTNLNTGIKLRGVHRLRNPSSEIILTFYSSTHEECNCTSISISTKVHFKKHANKKIQCTVSRNSAPQNYQDMVTRDYLIEYYKWLAEAKASSSKLQELLREDNAISISSREDYAASVPDANALLNNMSPQRETVKYVANNHVQSSKTSPQNETMKYIANNHVQSSSITSSWLKRWDVPWGTKETVIGMVSWVMSFGVSGIIVDLFANQIGWIPWLGGADDQSLYLLANEGMRTILSLCVVYVVVRPFQPLSPDFFVFDIERPFNLNKGWLLWSFLGFFSAFVAVQVSSFATANIFGHAPTRAEGDALIQVLPIIASSPLSTATLVTITGVCAPVLEETIFRGFLMTSLTKWMSTPAAVLLSSCAFAAAHLSPDQFPKLTVLGLVLGISYAKTRNLLTPIIIHSLWNSGIILILTLLRLEGHDISHFL